VARGFTQQAKNDRHIADTMLFPAKGFDPANAARAVLARQPAFVFLAGRTSDLGPLAEALRLAGYIGEFGASNGFYGEATTASYATVMANALVSTSLPPLDKIPDQIQQYTFLGNQLGQITAFSAFGFASAQIAILASQRANATTRLTLLSALQNGGTYDTLLGPFSFGVNGDPTLANIFLYKVTKDGFVFVKPAIATPYVI
jgi:ABC-type branched-subunit amino acid transport system substrate-binding protein